jgi:hypothetical protein
MEDVKDLKRQVINLATILALRESESGQDYTKCISNALDEACYRLNIDRKQFIKMFV